jgi:hypothetical protein
MEKLLEEHYLLSGTVKSVVDSYLDIQSFSHLVS